MITHPHRIRHRWRVVSLVLIIGLVPGCAVLPPAFSQASWALSGASYVTTSKGPSDHVISYATKKDCSLFRLLRLKPVCQAPSEETNQSLLSWLLDLLPSHDEEEILMDGTQIAMHVVD